MRDNTEPNNTEGSKGSDVSPALEQLGDKNCFHCKGSGYILKNRVGSGSATSLPIICGACSGTGVNPHNPDIMLSRGITEPPKSRSADVPAAQGNPDIENIIIAARADDLSVAEALAAITSHIAAEKRRILDMIEATRHGADISGICPDNDCPYRECDYYCSARMANVIEQLKAELEPDL